MSSSLDQIAVFPPALPKNFDEAVTRYRDNLDNPRIRIACETIFANTLLNEFKLKAKMKVTIVGDTMTHESQFEQVLQKLKELQIDIVGVLKTIPHPDMRTRGQLNQIKIRYLG